MFCHPMTNGQIQNVEVVNERSDMAEPVSSPPAGDEIVSSISKLTETKLNEDVSAAIGKLARDADQSAGNLSGLTELIEKDVVNSDVPLPRSKPLSFGTSEETAVKVKQVPLPTVEAASDEAPGTANADSRLVLKAKAPVWVRIEDRQGNVVLTKTFKTGDTYSVPNREGLIVIARDGGMLSYSIDGVDKGPLGEHGEILVGRSLDLSALSG